MVQVSWVIYICNGDHSAVALALSILHEFYIMDCHIPYLMFFYKFVMTLQVVVFILAYFH